MNTNFEKTTSEWMDTALEKAAMRCFVKCKEKGHLNLFRVKYLVGRDGKLYEVDRVSFGDDLTGIHFAVDYKSDVRVYVCEYEDLIQKTEKPTLTLFYIALIMLAREILDFETLEIYDEFGNVVYSFPKFLMPDA